jgi:hypothetical protein
MCVIIGISTREKDGEEAYFFCPVCRTRCRCVYGAKATYFTLFFVPLFPIATHREYYRCEVCQQEFDPDARFPYDFGEHRKPRRWDCAACGCDNPHYISRCKACGAEDA